MTILVVGSGNVDLVSQVDRIPAPGETVLATGFATHPGGKGNNQATAAARAGAATAFIGAFGADDNGTLLRESLTAAGVQQLIRTSPAPTGTALIAVSAAGENSIVVNAGANATLVALTDSELAAIAEADILLLQLEIPLTTVEAAASAATGVVVLNAAPAQDLPASLLAAVHLLIVNEHEAALLGGPVRLLTTVPAIIVTLGADGARVFTRDAESVRVPGIPVDVVDTTGAGDTFCGALVARLAELGGAVTPAVLEQATRFATAAAALSVRRAGAVPAIPTREEIDDFHRP